MQKDTYIKTRMNSELKSKVEVILSKLGLNPSDAITIFYNQILLNNGLPFEIKVPNAETRKTFEETDAKLDFNYAKSVKDLFEQLEK